VYGLRRVLAADYANRRSAERAVAVGSVMAASDVAAREIAKVLLKHVDQRTLRKGS
jgi:hypothetical protein